VPLPPWAPQQGLASVLNRWQKSRYVDPCLRAEQTRCAESARRVPLPSRLGAGLVRALEARGVHELYTHQAEAFEAARRGEHVVIATPTASGKSLCFHLPVLDAMQENPEARAIYLFPTKALARDQEAGLVELMKSAGHPSSAVVYDGDTPGDARRAARDRGGVVITNPDMLHSGILPHHTAWAKTLQRLAFIVVDELHVYRGVFGSHVAHVLARLLRVARFHGASPVLIAATATIGNPREHAARLFGLETEAITLVDDSGAPRGARKFLLFNPPVVNAELGIRASYVKQAVMLAGDLVKAGVPTLVFGQSRNNVEVMLRYLRAKVAPGVSPARVMAYRGGYLPAQRREIERKLREGELLGVVATSALELGIDIGDLDAVVCAGYPGSVASMWQRFGRGGRRGGLSLCLLVTSSAPVDQYLAADPEFLLGAPVEEARIDPSNAEILVQHLKCAAFEIPFRRGEAFGSLPPAEAGEALDFLARHRVLHEAGGTFHWTEDTFPASHVSLRTVSWDNVVIVDADEERSLAELDWRASHTMLHEQAIYQHDGECWEVVRFDQPNHKAFVKKVAPDYYTEAMTYARIALLEEAGRARSAHGWETGWGEVSVVRKVTGYKKIKFHTHENAGYGEVRLPEMEMHTTAFWLTVPEEVVRSLPAGRAAVIDALHGIGRALEAVSALALMCDPRDLAATLGDSKGDEPSAGTTPRGYDPTLFVYEQCPGGTGLAERIFEQRDTILRRARALVSGCACELGCPACVGPASATDGDGQPSRKRVALSLLEGLLPSSDSGVDVRTGTAVASDTDARAQARGYFGVA
jgi:DEAD/DEAH box helicase domain-containing protein